MTQTTTELKTPGQREPAGRELAAEAPALRAFLETMARDGLAAIQGFADCRSPFDVLAVQQAWVMARTITYVEAGQRAVAQGLDQFELLDVEAPVFRLPD